MDQKQIRKVLRASSVVQAYAHQIGLVPTRTVPALIVMFDTLVTESLLNKTTRQLFLDGHYALAVEEAYKCLNNVVKSRSKLTADGADLMRTAFSPKNPILKLNPLKTESQKNHQQGYMDIFAGCMTGIRNPRAHEHRYLDEPDVALEMLSLANHLLRLVQNAKLTRSQSGRRFKP